MQTFSSENRTQGQIEKSQQELKRTRLRNRKYKNLAELAVIYHRTHDGLMAEHEDGFRKEFAKNLWYYIHQSNIRSEVCMYFMLCNCLHIKKNKVSASDEAAGEKWTRRNQKQNVTDKKLGVYLQQPAEAMHYTRGKDIRHL